MSFELIIDVLIKKAGKSKLLDYSDLAKYAPYNSDLYFEIEKALYAVDIDIKQPSEDDDLDATDGLEDMTEEDEVEQDEEDDTEPDELSLSGLEIEEDELMNIETIASTVKIDDPIRMYLKEIGQIPLLTGEEERNHAMAVSQGRYAKERLEEAKKGTLELNREEVASLEEIVRKAKIAKDKLVEANYRLVVSIAKKHTTRGLLFLDLIQEGNMGLMRAVDKFDYEKGFKFSTMRLGGLDKQLRVLLPTKLEQLEFQYIWLKRLTK